MFMRGLRRSLALVLTLARDLLHQVHDAAPELRFFDARESLCEREPFRGGEEIGNVGRGGKVLACRLGACRSGAPSKKNSTGTWRMCAICCSRLAPIRFVPFSYFCTC